MKDNKYYGLLFADEKTKIEAFDKIAELYYDRNFGSTAKADFDVLMFSLYLDQILKASEEDMESYSDYALSKQLGITQAKVRNLKIKKELKYPYKDFDWRKSFARVCKNAYYVNEKINIHISDPNLFIELKHFVETLHRDVEITLNPSLFVVSVDVFIELLLFAGKEKDKKEILRNIRTTYQDEKIEIENIETMSIAKCLKDHAAKITPKVILKGLRHCADKLSSPLGSIVTNVIDILDK